MENKKEVILERVYDAPRDLVWKAWTDAEMLKQWWGPENVSIPECSIDVKVGGEFYIVMEAGEAMGPHKGTRWPMRAQFTVVEPESKLVYEAKAWTEGQEDKSIIMQTTEATFSEEDGKTNVKVVATIHNADTAPAMAVQGMQGGFTQQLGKLEKFLAGQK